MIAATSLGVSPAAAAQSFYRWLPLCDGFPLAEGIALGDVDGDNHLDVVFANG
jgi:hypothetical protein